MQSVLRLFCLTLLLALPGWARADITVPLSHGKLHLPIPDGYCVLNTDLARESTLYDVEAKTFEGRARLLGMAADCGELSAFRQQHTAVTRIVSFLLALKEEQGVRRADTERTQYLDELAKQFAHAGAGDFAANGQQWWNISNPAAQVESFGLAKRDSAAVYLQATRLLGRRDPATIASISAVTVADGYEVAVNFYMHGDDHSLPGLLVLAETEAQAIIAANVPAAAAQPDPANPAAAADLPPGAEGGDVKPLGSILAGSSSTIMLIAGGVLLLAVLALIMSRRSSSEPKTPARQ